MAVVGVAVVGAPVGVSVGAAVVGAPVGVSLGASVVGVAVVGTGVRMHMRLLLLVVPVVGM